MWAVMRRQNFERGWWDESATYLHFTIHQWAQHQRG